MSKEGQLAALNLCHQLPWQHHHLLPFHRLQTEKKKHATENQNPHATIKEQAETTKKIGVNKSCESVIKTRNLPLYFF
ncbi:hypothetical protein V6Z12_A07G082100 [Gossypium hirsutum]